MHLKRDQHHGVRATLLLGVAGAAAAVNSAAFADQAPAQPPADPQKWSPYTSIEGSAGSGMVAGKLDLFVPLFQNMDSLVFLNLGVGTETKAHTLFNAGLGYRTEIDSEWIIGAYVNHDTTQLQDNNTFGQTALGAELMSADWDLRLNGYLADNRPKPVPGDFSLYINGTTIAVLQAQEVGYTGFDGEVGYRVFSNDTTDVRVFIGGFHFSHSDTNSTSTGEAFDFGYRDLSGPKARAEATVYDLDVLGNQSRFTLEGEIAHDDVRGTTGFVGATLRIALGNFTGGGGAQALDDFDRRMVDPERRNDTVLTRAEFTKPEPVIIYGAGVKSQPTNTLLYVDNTQGVGTYANPTTFADATSRPTTNAFIVLTSKQGPITGGGTLQPGQTVVAGGETFSVQGAYSHATFSHLFDPSTNVTLMPSSPGANVITLAPNTSIHGFNIVGDFGNAIYGKNVQNVSINNVAIDGTGGGVNGINIVRTVSGNQNISISNTSIANLTGSGIRIDTNVTDGKNTTETFTAANLTINKVGADGIHIDSYAGDGSQITSVVTISNASVTGAGADGVDIAASANGMGSSIGETLTATNLTVSGPQEDGIYIGTHAEAGAQATSKVTLTNLTLSGAHGDGVDVYTYATGAGSTISEGLTFTNITATGAGSDGFHAKTTAEYGGAITSQATIANVTATNPGRDGIYFSARGYGGSVDQTLAITNATVNGAGRDGLDLRSTAYISGAAYQKLGITNAKISNAGRYGIDLYTKAAQLTAQATTNAALSNLTINGAGADGIHADALAYFAFTGQTIGMTNVSVSNSGGSGIFLDSAAAYGQAASAIALTNVSVTGSRDDGVFVGSFAGYSSSTTQSIVLSNVNATNNGGTGIVLTADATSYSTSGQTVSITGATISNDGGGLVVGTEADTRSYSSQSATLSNVSVSNMAAQTANFGIQIDATALNGSAIVQSVNVASVSVSRAGTGLSISAAAFDNGYGQTTVDQTVTVTGSTFANNSGSGIEIANRAATSAGGYHSQAADSQTVSIAGTSSFNNGAGLIVTDYAANGASANQDVSLYGVAIEHNTGVGAYVSATAETLGFAGQSVALHDKTGSYNQIAYNGSNGITLKSTASTAGEINQHLYVYSTHVDHNAGDGVSVSNTSGGYLIGAQVYYTHLQQNMIFAYGSLSHNGGNGISVANTVGYAAQADQIIQLYKVSVDYNALNGFHETSTATTYRGLGYTNPTNLHSDIYIQNADISHNGQSGIAVVSHLNSPLYKPGNVAYSYLEQHITVASATVDHNGGTGFVDGAYDQGVFGINIHYVTLQASDFSNNGRGGAYFVAHQVYGPGSFGAAEQIVTIAGSAFDHNARNGLYAYAYAAANQGRAEQHFTLQSLAVSATSTLANHFDDNGVNGIYLRHVAQNGVYVKGFPCTAVQGLTGGCAFVRTTFDMFGGTANGNHENGLVVSNYASNFAAVYDASGRPHAPTVYLNGVQLDDNKNGSGFTSYTGAKSNSYAFSFVVAVDTNFNNNHLNGFNTVSYATKGSAILEQNILYSYQTGTTVNGNGGFGVALASRATVGSAVFSQNELFGTTKTNGITVSHNGADGVFIQTGYDDATSRAQQINYFRGNTISYNGHDGVALVALGNGAGAVGGGIQYSELLANTVTANERYGLYGLSATGATQVVNVYTGGNTITGNEVADFHFVNLGGVQAVF